MIPFPVRRDAIIFATSRDGFMVAWRGFLLARNFQLTIFPSKQRSPSRRFLSRRFSTQGVLRPRMGTMGKKEIEKRKPAREEGDRPRMRSEKVNACTRGRGTEGGQRGIHE